MSDGVTGRDHVLRWPGLPPRSAPPGAALPDPRFADPGLSLTGTFGLELRVAAAFDAVTPSGSFQLLPLFTGRPASEAVLALRHDAGTIWSALTVWRIDDVLLDTMVTGLTGAKAERRTRPGRSRPDREGARTLFASPDDGGGLAAILRSLGQADLDPWAFACGAFAATVILHPFIDGNGRLARALFQGALASRRRLTAPTLPLGPASYCQATALIAAVRALGVSSDWHPLMTTLAQLTTQSQAARDALR